MSMITEEIDSNEKELYEGFEQLTSLIKNNSITNKDIRRYNKILKNLTKQIWSKFNIYQKRHQRVAKNKNYVAMPMDKKFFDGFLKGLEATPETVKGVYELVDKDIKIANKAFSGVRTGKKSKEEVDKYLKRNNTSAMKIATRVINAMALETTLQNMNEELDIDDDDVKDQNKFKVIKKMNNATKGVGRDIFQGINRAISDRDGK